jgi:hypothetical protein
VPEAPVVEEVGPEWTRKPLPLPNPALLPRMATMPPGVADHKEPAGVQASGRSGVLPAGKETASAARSAGSSVSGAPGAPVPGVPVEGAAKSAPAAEPAVHVPPPAPNGTGAGVTAEAPLRIKLAANRGSEGRYRRGEWVVLRMTASAPCYAALYRVGASGEVKQALAPEEKPAGSYGVAIKAGDYGAGEEWVVAVASAEPLPESQVIALLQTRPETVPDGPALNAVLAHLIEGREAEAMPSTAPEAWSYAMVVARYEVVEPAPATGTKGAAATRGAVSDLVPGQ